MRHNAYLRPELQWTSHVLAFGVAASDDVEHLFHDDLVEFVTKSAALGDVDVVVIDLRNVGSLSTTVLGELAALQRRLQQWNLLLAILVADPISREVVSGTDLDRRMMVAENEVELRQIVESRRQEGAVDANFCEQTLATMVAEGFTLDDAIRAMEQEV